MSVLTAFAHLQARLPEITAKKDRPRWSLADLEAVQALLDQPARSEQIALARIEGRVAGETALYSTEIKEVERIARNALGLAVTR